MNAGLLCTVASGHIGVESSSKSADFAKYCSVHDRCYWTLGSDRGSCDNEFKQKLTEECHRTYNTAIDVLARGCCVLFAEAFGGAVRGGGQDAYSNGQKDADEVSILYTQSTHLPFNSTLSAMTADYCATNVEGESCLTDKVSALLIGHVNEIRSIYLGLLNREASEADQSRFMDQFWITGKNLDAIRRLVIAENAPEIISAKAQRELGVVPSAEEMGMLVGVINNFDFNYFETQFYITYGKQAIAYFYRTTHGKEITPVWSMYYEQTLLKTKDLEKVKALIAKQKV